MKIRNRNNTLLLIILTIIGITNVTNAQQKATSENALSPKEQSIISISEKKKKGDSTSQLELVVGPVGIMHAGTWEFEVS